MKPRCRWCGRYVSWDAVLNGCVCVRFTPDTHFTYERTEYEHVKCAQPVVGEKR